MTEFLGRHLQLEQQRLDMLDRLRRIRRDRLHVETDREPDHVDAGTARENDDVLEQLEASIGQQLAQVVRALARLDQGRGDECERCGQPIEEQRLRVIPYATTCAECARLN